MDELLFWQYVIQFSTDEDVWYDWAVTFKLEGEMGAYDLLSRCKMGVPSAQDHRIASRFIKDVPVEVFCACDPTGAAQEWHPNCTKPGRVGG